MEEEDPPLAWWDPALEEKYRTFSLPQAHTTPSTQNERPWNERVRLCAYDPEDRKVNTFADMQRFRIHHPDTRPTEQFSTPPHLEYCGTELLPEKQPNQVRTRSIRWKPNQLQRKVIRKWMLGCRLLYNWALRTLKRQYKRDGKCAIYPGNKQAMKRYFLQCPIDKYPRRLQWIRTQVPDNVKYYALARLATAYSNEFLKIQQRGEHDERTVFGNIRTKKKRNHRNGIRSVIDIDTMNFNLKKGESKKPRAEWQRQWTFYSKTFKDCPDMRTQIPKKERKWLEERGPQNAVKIVETNTGKFFLKIVVEGHLQPTLERAMGHAVGLDPGANPAHSFYSPTKLHSGQIGTQVTLDKMRKEAKKIDALKPDVYGHQAQATVSGKQRSRLQHRIHKSYARLSHWGDQLVHQTSRYLVDNYQYIEASTFAVEKIVPRREINGGGPRRLHKVSVRDLMAFKHGMFKRELQHKVDLLADSFVRFGPEHYGTKTCTRCGRITPPCQFRNETFHCMNGGAGGCGYKMNKEVSAARNHLLKRVNDYEWIESPTEYGLDYLAGDITIWPTAEDVEMTE